MNNTKDKTKKKNIHIIFIDEDGEFILSKDKHIRFIYL